MPFEIRVFLKEQGITQRSVQNKIINKVVKETWQEVGRYWHRNMFPSHFEAGAGSKYGYRPRQDKWKKRKIRQVGEDIDLVFTGNMRDMMVHFRRIGGTAKRIRVTMDGPTYVYFHNKAREATRITPGEERQLTKVAEEIFEFKTREAVLESRPEQTRIE